MWEAQIEVHVGWVVGSKIHQLQDEKLDENRDNLLPSSPPPAWPFFLAVVFSDSILSASLTTEACCVKMYTQSIAITLMWRLLYHILFRMRCVGGVKPDSSS